MEAAHRLADNWQKIPIALNDRGGQNRYRLIMSTMFRQ
jgi:hypothetical protein